MFGKWIAPGQSRLCRDESLELGSGENLRDAERLKAEVRSQRSEVRILHLRRSCTSADSSTYLRDWDLAGVASPLKG
jgi:hypothetical protein